MNRELQEIFNKGEQKSESKELWELSSLTINGYFSAGFDLRWAGYWAIDLQKPIFIGPGLPPKPNVVRVLNDTRNM